MKYIPRLDYLFIDKQYLVSNKYLHNYELSEFWTTKKKENETSSFEYSNNKVALIEILIKSND